MRFSGHESFACRYAWLPKAYRALLERPDLFVDEERAMVDLGVGKNMVRSIRFWVEVMGVAAPQEARQFEPTQFGQAVLGVGGHDPFLEDTRTLWLLHWKLSTHADDPVFAWRFLINHWPYAELTRSEALSAFRRESQRLALSHSDVTLAQHLDVFLHTYIASRKDASPEDSLAGPLADLDFLQHAGERRVDGAGRREAVFAFRREPKQEITPEIFDYCLHDYWQQWHPEEATLTFRDVALAICSIGQVFKLPEEDIRERLERLANPKCNSSFAYQPSAVQGLISRRRGRGVDAASLLASVYGAPVGVAKRA